MNAHVFDKPAEALDPASIMAIERPDPKLMIYYALCCFIIPPLFPILIIPNFFRYHTLRYRFDNEGVSMRWGVLFRREVSLNYARIQDIHLQSNFVERWLGLGRVLVQTASGSSAAEMTIEGLVEFEKVRDFLYARMRGARERSSPLAGSHGGVEATSVDAMALTAALQQAALELRNLRESIERSRTSS
ncbi:MAG: PH domain-containing protein [Verrucomicrobia bacterium]|nr:PH domain-containing protein [Verrucomicrobiota bacterium]